MAVVGTLKIEPPFLNSSCPWASDFGQLEALFTCEYTGAVTTRTATLKGFDEDEAIHTVAFSSESYSSINSYGYSPRPLKEYLSDVLQLFLKYPGRNKPFIISITTSSTVELAKMLDQVVDLCEELDSLPQDEIHPRLPASQLIGVELNTSCPNIPGKPPPSYVMESLEPLLYRIAMSNEAFSRTKTGWLTIGLKLPPYVYSKQFEDAASALVKTQTYFPDFPNAISFITCTNTLGSNILLAEQTTMSSTGEFALPTVFGGMAGEAIHSLALGNVMMFAKLLLANPSTADIKILGVGGVTSPAAAKRMFKVGATAVECATALGKEGVGIFGRLQS